MTSKEKPDIYTLFMHAVDVTNEALAKHSDKPFYSQVIGGAENILAGRELGVAVYKETTDKPFDYFTLRFDNGKFELAARGKESPDVAWKVSEEYLEKVYSDPERYINNPLLLDIDWLKSRLKS